MIMRRMINDTKTFSLTKKMEKLYCVSCIMNRIFEKPKIWYFLEETLVLSITCSKFKNKDEKIFK